MLECSVRDNDGDKPRHLVPANEPLLSSRQELPPAVDSKKTPRALEEGRGQGSGKRGEVPQGGRGRHQWQAVASGVGEEVEEIVQEEVKEVREMEATAWKFMRKLRWQLLGVGIYFAGGCWYYGRVCGWDLLDCMYFATAIVTTVGYGDVVPPHQTGPLLFTCGYIFFAILIIATTISTVLDEVMSGQLLAAMETVEEKQTEALRNMIRVDESEASRSRSRSRSLAKVRDDSAIFADRKAEQRDKRIAKYLSLARAVIWGLLCLGGGMAIYMVLETKSGHASAFDSVSPWVRALYFSIVTLTTVGFGDVVPKTDEFKAFDILFMIVGIPVFGNLLATLLNFMSDSDDDSVQARLVQVKDLDENKMEDLLAFENELHGACAGKLSDGQPGNIDCMEYMAFILVRNGVIKMSTIEEIVTSFNKLDRDGSGFINMRDILRLKSSRIVGRG